MQAYEVAQEIIDAFDDAAMDPAGDRITMTNDFYKQILRPTLKIIVDRDKPLHPVLAAHTWHCSKCRSPILVYGRNRCPHCGQALVWEEDDRK